MDYYVDIRLRPDPEFPSHQLMDALFAKLHRVLVRLDADDIGLSFPDVADSHLGLGSRLRLHGHFDALAGLMAQPWLIGMSDHVLCTEPMKVPPEAGHFRVRRVQAKSGVERLRRRQMRRKGWTEAQAKAAIPGSAAETLNLPFLTVRSSSTGQAFHLFIEQKPVLEADAGRFNAYGFSPNATVPRF